MSCDTWFTRCQSGDEGYFFHTYVSDPPNEKCARYALQTLSKCEVSYLRNENSSCESQTPITFTDFMKKTNNYEKPFIYRAEKTESLCQLEDLFPEPCGPGKYYDKTVNLCKALTTQCATESGQEVMTLVPANSGYKNNDCDFKTGCNRPDETIGIDYYYNGTECVDQTIHSCPAINGQHLIKYLEPGSPKAANECLFKPGCDDLTKNYYDSTQDICTARKTCNQWENTIKGNETTNDDCEPLCTDGSVWDEDANMCVPSCPTQQPPDCPDCPDCPTTTCPTCQQCPQCPGCDTCCPPPESCPSCPPCQCPQCPTPPACNSCCGTCPTCPTCQNCDTYTPADIVGLCQIMAGYARTHSFHSMQYPQGCTKYHVNNAPGNYSDGWMCDMFGNCQE